MESTVAEAETNEGPKNVGHKPKNISGSLEIL